MTRPKAVSPHSGDIAAPGNSPLPESQILHATTVAYLDRAVLILGPSGSGKSALALQMMALGASLVADDRTRVWGQDGAIWAKAPPGLPALIEARGLGLLPVAALAPATRIALCVDMAQVQTARMPEAQKISLLGQSLPLVFQVAAAHFPSSLMLYLTHGPLA